MCQAESRVQKKTTWTKHKQLKKKAAASGCFCSLRSRRMKVLVSKEPVKILGFFL